MTKLAFPHTAENIELLRNVHPPEWVNPTYGGVYDLIVLGAGYAGMTAASHAADKGAKVALVEKAMIGGECFNIGCIPSKSIIRTSRLYADMQNARNFGGEVQEKSNIDFTRVMTRIQRIRTQISGHISVQQLQKKNIDIYFGHGQFVNSSCLTLNGSILKFKKAIIATGSQPAIPDISGLSDVDYFTNETIFNISYLPEKLLVIGGGGTGCELAQAFCRLGSEVTIVQVDPMFLNNVERDGAQILSDSMAQDGVNIHLNSVVTKIQKSGDKKLIEIISAGVKTTITVTDILIGVGQKPNTANLDLTKAGVESNEAGHIKVNKYFRTSNRNIYAVGSVCNGPDFTYVPVAMARSATDNALFRGRTTINATTIPWCIYTDPEIAHIGLQVLEARSMNIPVKTFTILMHEVDRAIADSEDMGFVKIHVKEGTDIILGATIVARHAGDIINSISLAMNANIGLSELAKINYPYPTQGDAIRKAAIACMHTLRPSLLSQLRTHLKMRGPRHVTTPL